MVNLLFELFERIRVNCSGNANFLTAFLDPYDLSTALQANGALRIDVFQNENELYELAGGEGAVRFKEYPRPAEVPCDTFPGFKLHRQLPLVSLFLALLNFFHGPPTALGFDIALRLLKHNMPTDTFFYIFRYIIAKKRASDSVSFLAPVFCSVIALLFRKHNMPGDTFFYIFEDSKYRGRSSIYQQP